MMIVPAGGRMVARLEIPDKAVGFVRPGQPVMLALDAYPYERFGSVQATIRDVASAPVLKAAPNGDGSTVYMATALVPQPFITAYGRKRQLVPGMTLKARIVTEKRSLIHWLFDPLYAAARR